MAADAVNGFEFSPPRIQSICMRVPGLSVSARLSRYPRCHSSVSDASLDCHVGSHSLCHATLIATRDNDENRLVNRVIDKSGEAKNGTRWREKKDWFSVFSRLLGGFLLLSAIVNVGLRL